MSDQLTSWLRTIVPLVWGALLAWMLAHHWLPAGVVFALGPFGEQFLVPLVMAVVYAGLRKLEPHMPDWLTRILLGSARPPSYPPAG